MSVCLEPPPPPPPRVFPLSFLLKKKKVLRSLRNRTHLRTDPIGPRAPESPGRGESELLEDRGESWNFVAGRGGKKKKRKKHKKGGNKTRGRALLVSLLCAFLGEGGVQQNQKTVILATLDIKKGNLCLESLSRLS